ncbi:HAD family hydrolase [Clostridiales bacterium PH28_bin88]|nr:HAD family hydrolase [Clostridiales bacterium PH28_bin88]
MLELLRPDMYVHSIHKIPLDQLKAIGIKGLIIDLDNTLTGWNLDTVSSDVSNWLTQLPDYSLKACLVSNNRAERVSRVAETLGFPYVFNANKPRRKAFRQAMQQLGTGTKTTAVIGDQIFTDILGGNRLSLFTILVVPISQREFIGTRLVRLLEQWALRKFRCEKI